MAEPNILVSTLSAAHARVRGKLVAAQKRLVFAESQVVSETAQIAEGEFDLAMLARAIADAGGVVSEDEPDEEA